MSLTIIDSPKEQGCHGLDVIESAEEVFLGDSLRHVVIDQDCTGSESSSKIDRKIRGEAKHKNAVNVSWGGPLEISNPLWDALVADNSDSPDFSPAEVVFNAGGMVFYASGNAGHREGIATADMFSTSVGAYNTDDGTLYDFANRWQGLFVPIWANGQAPGGALGTSFAAPRVAAWIGTLYERGFTTAEAMTALYRTSKPINNPQSLGDYALLNEEALETLGEPYEIGISEIIMAAYVVMLGRRPDMNGWQYWIDDAESRGLDTTIEAMAFSAKENNEWKKHEVPVARRIQCHYHLMLGREPHIYEWAYWLDNFSKLNYGGDGSLDYSKLNWDQFTADFFNSVDCEAKHTDVILG